MQANNTDEDMSNFRACSLCSIVEKRAAPARPSTTVSAFETRLRPLERSIDKAPRCRVSCATSIVWKVDIFS